MNVALVTGATGQDGSYLVERLLAEGLFGCFCARDHDGLAVPADLKLDPAGRAVERDVGNVDDVDGPGARQCVGLRQARDDEHHADMDETGEQEPREGREQEAAARAHDAHPIRAMAGRADRSRLPALAATGVS